MSLLVCLENQIRVRFEAYGRLQRIKLVALGASNKRIFSENG